MKRRNFLKNIGLAVAVAPIASVLKAEEKPESIKISGTSIDDSGNRIIDSGFAFTGDLILPSKPTWAD